MLGDVAERPPIWLFDGVPDYEEQDVVVLEPRPRLTSHRQLSETPENALRSACRIAMSEVVARQSRAVEQCIFNGDVAGSP